MFDNSDWHDNDEEILAFQEEYPDVYDFVLKVLDSRCDDAILQAFEDDYGNDCLDYILNIISGQASEKDIQEFREEYGDEFYLPIKKIIQRKKDEKHIADKLREDEDINNEEILAFQEEYPDFYNLVQKVLEGNCNDSIMNAFKDEYGEDCIDYILNIISGEASEKAIQELRDEFGDEICNAVVRMIQNKKRQRINLSESGPVQKKFKKGDFIGTEYEVYDVLGEGGFGIVYLVYSHRSKEVYALKTFRDEYLADIKTKERFWKEAQVWIDLDRHPYIVRAPLVEKISGKLYISMEHIGKDEKGVKAHRDIKPANIMIDQNKTVRITDFGLAGVLSQSACLEQSTVQRESGTDSFIQTVVGTSIGTPEYMSPEQFEDLSACDERSDIYSFGIVLYQMASGGRLPFSTDNPSYRWTALKHFHQETSVPKLNSPLLPIIQRCLEKAQGKRYQTFRELRAVLDPLLRRESGVVVKLPELKELEAWELLCKGLSLLNLGKYQEALACCGRALELDSRYANAWFGKGVSLLNLGKYQEALACYGRALELDPRHVAAWLNKGIALLNLDRVQEAIACYDKALEINSRYAEAWYYKGVSLDSLGKYRDEVVCYDKALEINPKYAKAWYSKGAVISNIGKPQEAVACFDKALEIDPRDDTWYSKGIALVMLGKFQEAVACFDKALEINPRLAKAWIRKGFVEDKLYKTLAAITSYKQFLELASKDDAELIAYARKRLEELEGE